MLVFDVLLIAAFFPVFGACVLRACEVKDADLETAAAYGFTLTLLIGTLFYDVGMFQFFVPIMACLLAIFVLLYSLDLVNDVTIRGKPNFRLLLVLFIFGCVALLGRVPVSNFIFEIGDAGGYVNSANHLARAGSSITQFFPLNQVLLGIFATIGGPAVTPYGVLVASMASTWFAVLTGRAYFGGWRAGWLTGFVVSLNVLAMWFGRLPYSESLMLACNLGALAYWKMAADDKPGRYRYYVLFGMFVAAASLTRVTGILWMLVMSGTLLFLCARRSERTRPFVLAFCIAALGYALSVQIALKWGENYYINWQLHSFLPWLKTPKAVIWFHCAWALGVVSLALALYKLALRIRFPSWISKRTDVITLLGFIGFLFLATAHFNKDWHQWLVVGAASRLATWHLPEDSYYLVHYFTAFAIPLFFGGWYFLFRNRDPFKDESWSVFWLFSAFFMMVSYIRPTYGKSHDVYMYWDRYFVSDTFIVFVLAICTGTIWCVHNKFARWLAVIFVSGYLIQAAIWIGINRNSKYLSEGYEMIAWLESSIPRSNSVIFLDNQYGGHWLFPNLRRTILIPLSHSFGYSTEGAGVEPGPFSPDASLNRAAVNEALRKGKQVYIIFATKTGQGLVSSSPTLPIEIVGRRAFIVTAKPSLQGRVFAGGSHEYPIALTIGQVWSGSVNIESPAATGIYADNIWTDGNANFRNVNLCPPAGSRRIMIQTYGYIPASITENDVNLEIFVNGVRLGGAWSSRTSYTAEIPKSIGCVQSLSLKSNTFIPKKMGINNDSRPLGLDLKSITVE